MGELAPRREALLYLQFRDLRRHLSHRDHWRRLLFFPRISGRRKSYPYRENPRTDKHEKLFWFLSHSPELSRYDLGPEHRRNSSACICDIAQVDASYYSNSKYGFIKTV